MKHMKRYVPSFVLLSVIAIFWELYSRLGHISKTVLPAPTDILKAGFNFRDILFMHAAQTTLEALVGLSLAILLGVGTAIILFHFAGIRAAAYPVLILSQTIPIIALAPLLLIWFGFELTPKVIIVILYCFFPICIAVYDAISKTDENLVDLLKSMGATPFQVLRLIRLPAALPSFFSGLRISVAYAITGAIVGEYVGAYKGLGVFMQVSANSHAIDLVFAALLLTAIISIGLLACVSIIESKYTPWRQSYE